MKKIDQKNLDISNIIKFDHLTPEHESNKSKLSKNLVKIDIEGAEIEVINHIIDTGTINKIRKLICEVHDKKYKFLSENTGLLRKKIKDLNLDKKINLDWH